MKYWVVFIAVVLYSIYRLQDFPAHDFTNLYFAGLFLNDGQFDEKSYDAYYFNMQIVEAGYENVFTGFYPNTPYIAICFTIFSIFTLYTAKHVFVYLSLILFLIGFYRLFSALKIPKILLWLVPVVFYTAIKNNILFGQAYLLIFFLLAEGFIAYKKGKQYLSSVLWCLAIFLKIFPVFILLFALFIKNKRLTLYLIGNSLFALCLLLLIFNFHFLEFYTKEVLLNSVSGKLFGGFSPAAESAVILFKNLFIADNIANPNPVFSNIYAFHIIQVIYKSTILVFCTIFTIHSKADAALKFSMWLIAGLLFSPHLSTYSSIIMLIPFLAVLSKREDFSPIFCGLFVFVALLFCNLPADRFQSISIWLTFSRLGLLLLLFAMTYYVYRPPVNLKKIAIPYIAWLFAMSIAAFPNFFEDLKERASSDTYFLTQNKHLLITNFDLEDGEFYYMYWSDAGINKENTILRFNTIETDGISLIGNQIFYQGEQMTFGNDRKRLPKIIDGRWIVYLSDKNRGLGFYTLRKISI